MMLVRDTVEAARHAGFKGWITEWDIFQIAEEKKEDERKTTFLIRPLYSELLRTMFLYIYFCAIPFRGQYVEGKIKPYKKWFDTTIIDYLARSKFRVLIRW